MDCSAENKGPALRVPVDNNVYVIAIDMGTSVAFVVYGLTGHLLIFFLLPNQNLFNWMVGIALLVTGLVQVWKLVPRSSR